MAKIGSEIVAEALKQQGIEDFFYIMGGPMMAVENACMDIGIRGIDVRHEQAGAMAAFAYARLRNRPGVCMAASGPATTNLITGLAHAWADCTPVVALGGAAPDFSTNRGAFQDIDQLSMMKPCSVSRAWEDSWPVLQRYNMYSTRSRSTRSLHDCVSGGTVSHSCSNSVQAARVDQHSKARTACP